MADAFKWDWSLHFLGHGGYCLRFLHQVSIIPDPLMDIYLQTAENTIRIWYIHQNGDNFGKAWVFVKQQENFMPSSKPLKDPVCIFLIASSVQESLQYSINNSYFVQCLFLPQNQKILLFQIDLVKMRDLVNNYVPIRKGML